MPRSLIVYFSQGGTTALVAENIAAGLGRADYRVDRWNIRDGGPPDVGGYDLLGIGSPVYHYRPPFNVVDFLAGLPQLDGLPAFVFVLHGTYRSDAGTTMRRMLEDRGAREVGYFHCYGVNFYAGHLKAGYVFSPGHPREEELAQAEAFGLEVAAHAAGREYARPKDDPQPPPLCRLERLVANRWLARNVHSRLFRADASKCDSCGLCLELCPVGNLGVDGSRRPVWGRDCLLCLTCELKCPRGAVIPPASLRLFRPITAYSARLASRDPWIDHVRIDPELWSDPPGCWRVPEERPPEA